MISSAFLLQFLSVFLVATVQASINLNPTIKTTSGTLIGETISLNADAQVHRFLGVPFAQAPIGENRFEKPQPLSDESESLLLAQQAKPTCIQMRHLSQTISPLLEVDQYHNVSLPRTI